ncbi:flavodoxin family protein [Dactylosporangium darangshiense]|uniref:NAD(P)H:quinone oxidoreductase n=1 Tax=Dactylosporangium darangshiense TaxID=579108 RepID=A0ABP8DQG1_9ACTN
MARILIVYSSLSGANAMLAGLAASALGATGAEVRVRRVPEVAFPGAVQPAADGVKAVSADDLAWADGFVLSSQSHTGLLSASIKAFIDAHHDAAVAGSYLNKTFTAMATSAFAHAGQERVVDELNAVGAAWGCILVPPSVASARLNVLNGNPYGLSFVLEQGRIPDTDAAREVLDAHLHRFAAITDAMVALSAASAVGGESALNRRIPTAAEVFS